MKYFKSKINLQIGKKEVQKAIKSLIYKGDSPFFIFPFCLFKKSFYTHIKEKRKQPYSGSVNGNEFELARTMYYGSYSSGRTSRQLTIKGEIIEEMDSCIVKLEFHLEVFDIIINSLIILSCLVAIFVFNEYVSVLILTILFADLVYFTIKNYLKIRNRINRENNKNNVP